jgi:hypothetical protein
MPEGPYYGGISFLLLVGIFVMVLLIAMGVLPS